MKIIFIFVEREEYSKTFWPITLIKLHDVDLNVNIACDIDPNKKTFLSFINNLSINFSFHVLFYLTNYTLKF